MVHALQEIHRVLKVGGSLIDLRPAISNRTVEIELPYARLHVGEIDSVVTIPDHLAADRALQNQIAEGQLRAEYQESFELVTELDTLADLLEYAASLRQSVLPEAVLQRVEAIIADETEDFSIRTRREMVIARYRRTGKLV